MLGDILGGHEDLVTANLRVDDLADDVLVGEADDKTVLGRIVLVLRLGDQPLARIVVGCETLAGLGESQRGYILLPCRRRLYLTWYREK